MKSQISQQAEWDFIARREREERELAEAQEWVVPVACLLVALNARQKAVEEAKWQADVQRRIAESRKADEKRRQAEKERAEWKARVRREEAERVAAEEAKARAEAEAEKDAKAKEDGAALFALLQSGGLKKKKQKRGKRFKL